ncbi:alpha/beta hydrolase [Paenibacillus sp.]|uniref:alpha/beta fold hydrolase n=1 Tax=Paenibacillus sp. TaxID=58172 RepID=UPI00281B8E99|nr:alpha/beta hydrolase [Paenibacillus sp.]MDR0270099.1 alpha/beta hydrolase [Paenibacillus sp.]
MFFARKTPKISSSSRSVSLLEKIRVRGTEQWILMRGKSIRLPVLLWLHGGPGTAQIGFAPYFLRELEQHFVVVNWDQRGAGLSYCKGLRADEMNLEQFICSAPPNTTCWICFVFCGGRTFRYCYEHQNSWGVIQS